MQLQLRSQVTPLRLQQPSQQLSQQCNSPHLIAFASLSLSSRAARSSLPAALLPCQPLLRLSLCCCVDEAIFVLDRERRRADLSDFPVSTRVESDEGRSRTVHLACFTRRGGAENLGNQRNVLQERRQIQRRTYIRIRHSRTSGAEKRTADERADEQRRLSSHASDCSPHPSAVPSFARSLSLQTPNSSCCMIRTRMS